MAEVITMPKLGLDMTEGTFVNWVKKEGDSVKAGDVIAEIESDKATIEIESTASGVLRKTLVEVGQVVPVGAPIAEVSAEGAESASTDVAKEGPATGRDKQTPNRPEQVPAPKPAPQPVAEPTVGSNGQAGQAEAAEHEESASQGEEFPGGVKASPIARRVAEERGIDLKQIKGTGPSGRITKSDVENFTPSAAPAAAPEGQAQAATAPAPAAPKPLVVPTGPGISAEPISRLRSRIAARMVESKTTVPHFYVTADIDMAPALALRKQINEGLPEDQKVSVNDLVIKAVALTLRQFPNLNSHYYGDKIVHHEHINIGIAVALDGGGLMNVVAKDADSTSISRMAQRNKQMIANARAGKVRPEEIEGSTFTVSNLGAYDVEHFVAIINPPEAGILAVGSAKEVPVVVNGEIKIGTRMKVTLSVDHRVSDGAEGAKFLQALKALLENPMRLLI